MPTAAETVFGIPELLEQILIFAFQPGVSAPAYLKPSDREDRLLNFRVRKVSRAFNNALRQSPALRHSVLPFFMPNKSWAVVPPFPSRCSLYGELIRSANFRMDSSGDPMLAIRALIWPQTPAKVDVGMCISGWTYSKSSHSWRNITLAQYPVEYTLALHGTRIENTWHLSKEEATVGRLVEVFQEGQSQLLAISQGCVTEEHS